MKLLNKNTIYNLILLLVSLLVALTITELLLQKSSIKYKLIHVGKTSTPKAKLYGWTQPPNKEMEFINPDTHEKSSFKTNSEGWKDVEHTFNKPKGVIRILFIGDSYTWGAAPLKYIYSRQVENKLKQIGISRVEVISMGVGGWGTDQELEALKQEGVKYKPDIVIYQFCGNDLGNNMLPIEGMEVNEANKIYLYKPFRYEMREGSLSRIDLPPVIDQTRDSKLFQIKKYLLKSIIIYRINILKNKLFRGSQDSNKKVETQKKLPTWFRPLSPINTYTIRDDSPSIIKAFELLEALLLEMKTISENNMAKLVVFSENGDLGLRNWYLQWNFIQTDGDSYFTVDKDKKYPFDIKRNLKKLEKICFDNDIPLIKPQREYLRYRYNPHTNKKGNEQMAEDIVDFLLNWDHFRLLLNQSKGE